MIAQSSKSGDKKSQQLKKKGAETKNKRGDLIAAKRGAPAASGKKDGKKGLKQGKKSQLGKKAAKGKLGEKKGKGKGKAKKVVGPPPTTEGLNMDLENYWAKAKGSTEAAAATAAP